MLRFIGGIVSIKQELEPRTVDPVKEAVVGPHTKPLASEQQQCVGEAEQECGHTHHEQRDMLALEVVNVGIVEPDQSSLVVG